MKIKILHFTVRKECEGKQHIDQEKLIVTIVTNLSVGQICQRSNKIYVSISKEEEESDATTFWHSSLWGPTPSGALAIASSFIWVCIDCTMEKWWFILDLHPFDKLEGTSRLWSIDLWQSSNTSAVSREDCWEKWDCGLTLHFGGKLRGVHTSIRRHNGIDKSKKSKHHCSRSWGHLILHCWRPDVLARDRSAEKKLLHSRQTSYANSSMLSCCRS